jgi:hypothetical protein
MRSDGDRTPREWFEAAERWRLQQHQGCPCCGGRHCVFRSEWSGRVEFYCTACDFSASHDPRTGRYFVAAADGRERPSDVLDQLALPSGELAEGL